MPLSPASLGLIWDKKHWLIIEKKNSVSLIPFAKAHVLPGSSTATLQHDRPTLSFTVDWEENQNTGNTRLSYGLLGPSLHYWMVATLPD